jgi:hypothetical protein
MTSNHTTRLERFSDERLEIACISYYRNSVVKHDVNLEINRQTPLYTRIDNRFAPIAIPRNGRAPSAVTSDRDARNTQFTS